MTYVMQTRERSFSLVHFVHFVHYASYTKMYRKQNACTKMYQQRLTGIQSCIICNHITIAIICFQMVAGGKRNLPSFVCISVGISERTFQSGLFLNLPKKTKVKLGRQLSQISGPIDLTDRLCDNFLTQDFFRGIFAKQNFQLSHLTMSINSTYSIWR